MPVHFPETETKTPSNTYRGHQHRQDHHCQDHCQDHDNQGDNLNPDSDSDLIFDFELEDSSAGPGSAHTQGMDPEEFPVSITHPTAEDVELTSSLRPSTNSQGPLVEQNEQNIPGETQGTHGSQDSPVTPALPASESPQAPQASLESAPAQRYQRAQPQFWSHSSGIGNASSNPSAAASASALRGRGRLVTSRTAYSSLAPHAHQLHEGHRYVTGRGFGSPGWNPVSGSYGGNRNASSSSRRSADTQQGSQRSQSGQSGQSGQSNQWTGQAYQVWQVQPLQTAFVWPASRQPSQPPPQPPARYPQPTPLQRQWHYYGTHHQPPGLAHSASLSVWNPYNPLLDSTLQTQRASGGPVASIDARASVAAGILSHGHGAAKSKPASEPIRCLIVNGSKRPYDVDMLNRLAWGDLAALPVGAEAALNADDACIAGGAAPCAAVSLSSMVSGQGTLTNQGSLASVSRLQLQPLLQPTLDFGSASASEFTLTQTVPRETQTQTQTQMTSTALTTTSVAHHWILKLPPACWHRLARYVDDNTLLKLSTINRVFANARVKRVLRSEKREARFETLERVQTLERREKLERLERLDKMARLTELEERAAFAMGQLGRLSLSPSSSSQSGSTGHLIHGPWPRCPKACFRCFRVRQQSHFPRVLVLSAAARSPEATVDVDEAQVPADIRAALGKIASRFLESRPQDQPQGRRQQHRVAATLRQPMFVPYIPVPAETAGAVEAAEASTGDGRSRGDATKTASTSPTFEMAATPAGEEPSHFDRCCFECAISAGLIKAGERVVALDGSWRWVCRYGLAHAGGNEDICQQCHDEA